MTLRELAGTTLVLEAPDDVRSWVETRFTRLLTALAETVIGPGARVQIVGPEQHHEVERPRPEAQRAAVAQELNPRLRSTSS